MLDSPSQAISLLGGKHAVSDLTERPLTTVASWVARESIPVDVWPKLIDGAQDRRIKSITYETLAKAHAKSAAKRPQRKRAA